jgi:hypothetical protein
MKDQMTVGKGSKELTMMNDDSERDSIISFLVMI